MYLIQHTDTVCDQRYKVYKDLKMTQREFVFVQKSKFAWSVPSPTKRKPRQERHHLPSTSRSLDFTLETAEVFIRVFVKLL